jgi:hypothetical protein
MDYQDYLQNLPRSPKLIRSRIEWENQYPGVQDPILCGETGPIRTTGHFMAKEYTPKLPVGHIQGCNKCLKMLSQLDPKSFKKIVLSGASHSSPRTACVEMMPYIDGGGTTDGISLRPDESLDMAVHNCIGADHHLITILPSLEIQKMRSAPTHPGIYFVTTQIESKLSVLYVGKAQNIRERWKSHHRLPELDLLVSIGMKIQVSFLIIPDPIGSDRNLIELESHYIDSLSPKLNRKPVVKFVQQSIA